MRGKRAEQLDKDHKVITADGTCRVNIVDQRHQACDRRVELHCLDICCDLLDRFMEFYFHIRICRCVSHDIRQACHTLQETLAALYGAVIPRSCRAVITHKQYICTQGISAVLFYDIKRVNDIPL